MKRNEKGRITVTNTDGFHQLCLSLSPTKNVHYTGLFDRAIVLLWLENLSYEEIGGIVGISAKNVSVRLVRIKEQLKKMQ